jgi:LuxR family maltose regulon positive regulatory protein
MQSELTTFLGWVDRLPDDFVCTHPELCFFHAWALLMSGSSLSIVEQRLKYTSGAQEINAMMPGRMTALQAYLHLFQGEILRASKLSHQALQQLPEQDYFLRSIMNWIIGQVDLVDTDPQIASQMLKGVLHTALEAGNSLIAVTTLCHQAKLHMRLGQMPQAKVIFNQALQAATGPQGQRLPIASEALFGLGELEREWNNLERAEEYLAESIELYKQWSELASFDAYFPLARLRMAQGNSAGAQEALETARQIALSSDSTELDDLIADLQQAYFFAMQGKTAQVIQWAEKRGLLPAAPLQSQPGIDESQDYAGDRLRKYEHLILARLLILQGQPAQAIEILGAVRNLARQLKRTDLMIEIQILSALAFEIGGQNAQAIKALGEALRLAEPGGYMRIFLDEGEPMARLLQQFASLDIMPTYTEKLIRAFIAAQPFQQFDAAPTARRTLSEPLSEREQEVLRLLATGMSNPEIADQLVVAVSTVRSHCKSIFGKLGVHSRWDAAQRAKELGLL